MVRQALSCVTPPERKPAVREGPSLRHIDGRRTGAEEAEAHGAADMAADSRGAPASQCWRGNSAQICAAAQSGADAAEDIRSEGL